MGHTRSWSILCGAFWLIAMLAVQGCGGGTAPGTPANLASPAPAADSALPADPWPAFPPDAADIPPARQVSDDQYTVNGADFIEQSLGSTNFADPDTPTTYHLVPADVTHAAWAHWAVPGLTLDRPVSISLSVKNATTAPDSTDALPLSYFIGVANYTLFRWEWYGPYIQDAQIVLNSEQLTDRYLSAAGDLHFVIGTNHSPLTPFGVTGVAVKSATVTTSPDYVYNKPHYTPISNIYAGSAPPAAKSASYLEPSQFVTVEWEHVSEFTIDDLPNAAHTYRLYRQGPEDAEPLEIGVAFAPRDSFLDPIDPEPAVPEPHGGTTYVYSLETINEAGSPPMTHATITIPILAPRNVAASIDSTETDGSEISWDISDGAVEYEIWRGLSALPGEAELLDTISESALTYQDTTGLPGTTYWYFLRAIGIGDGDPANGLEPGALSGYSLGAQGLRPVIITVTADSPDSGSGTAGDPYIVTAGTNYQFQAADQLGNPLTNLCIWSVDPPSAGEFTGGPVGELRNIASAAGDFTITAMYNLLTYSWQGTVNCRTSD